MPKPSEVKAGAKPFGNSKEIVKPNRGLNEIARIRQAHSKEDLQKYNSILTKQGWKVNPEGEFFEIDNSEAGRGAPYYVSREKNMHNLTDPTRNHTSTWDEGNALRRGNIVNVANGVTNGSNLRRSRRNRRTTRRRASRKHRRTYRK